MIPGFVGLVLIVAIGIGTAIMLASSVESEVENLVQVTDQTDQTDQTDRSVEIALAHILKAEVSADEIFRFLIW